MSAFAHEDVSIVQHHARMEKGVVSKEMLDLSLSSGMGPINHLDHIALLHLMLLGIESHGIAILALLLQRRRFHTDHFAVHVQHLKGLLLDLHDHAHRLGVQLDHIPERVLTQRVHARGHIRAQLQILG